MLQQYAPPLLTCRMGPSSDTPIRSLRYRHERQRRSPGSCHAHLHRSGAPRPGGSRHQPLLDVREVSCAHILFSNHKRYGCDSKSVWSSGAGLGEQTRRTNETALNQGYAQIEVLGGVFLALRVGKVIYKDVKEVFLCCSHLARCVLWLFVPSTSGDLSQGQKGGKLRRD